MLKLEEKASNEKNKALLVKWIERNNPKAILTDRPFVQQLLEESGYRVPDDIGLATTSIHDTTIDAGIDQNPEEIGRAAVRLLAALVNQNDLGIPSIRSELLIEGKWVDGTMLPNRNN